MRHQAHHLRPLAAALLCPTLLCSALGILWAPFAAAQGPGYRLGAEDQVGLRVAEAPEFDGTYKLDQFGRIELKQVGQIDVNGRTTSEAERVLKTRLEERVLVSATVELVVTQPRSGRVTLLGAVARPGPIPIGPGATILQVLTEHGGVESGNTGIVQIRRSVGSESETITLPLDELMVRADPRFDLPLRDGDTINVPEGREITVYFAGELSGSVSFSAKERPTLVRAVSKASGLTDRSSGKIEITRILPDGTTTMFEVRYKQILEGAEPDVLLVDGDVLNVKRSFF